MKKLLLLSMLAIASFNLPKTHSLTIENHTMKAIGVEIPPLFRVTIPKRYFDKDLGILYANMPAHAEKQQITEHLAMLTLNANTLQRMLFIINDLVYSLPPLQPLTPRDRVNFISVFDDGITLKFANKMHDGSKFLGRRDIHVPFVTLSQVPFPTFTPEEPL